MDRRAFIQKTALLSVGACLAQPGWSWAQGTQYKLGYQLYSVNNDMKDKPLSTLKALQAMGYQDFEIYGFDGEKGTYYGYQAAEFKTLLDELGLTVSSGHYGFAPYLNQSNDQLMRFVDQCIAGAQALNSRYITWPWIAPEQRNMETFKRMVPVLNRIGQRVTEAGLGFAYHNHGFEFADHEGQNGFDIIVNQTDPAWVKLQMDMYWVMRSSQTTPKALVAKHPGRFVMWHIKDMDKLTQDYSELGNGSIDYTKILPDPVKSGLEFYYIEQGGNFAASPLQSAATSAAFFKHNLQSLI